MLTTIKSPSPRADLLPTVNSRRTTSPSKSSLLSDSSDILPGAVLHKRRPQKRVRFAVKSDHVEDDSLPSSREASPSLVSNSSRRVVDPWRQDGPLYGAYVEYLDKQDISTNNELSFRRTPPPSDALRPEPGAEPPTYTHTFVIQSRSPELVVDSITVSTPPLYLPRILHRSRRTNKQQLPTLDSYVRQQLTLSTSPRTMHTKKLVDLSDQTHHYASVHAAIKRADLSIPPTNGLSLNNRVTRSDNSFGSKFINDHIQQRKRTEFITKPLSGAANQINHFSERTILPNYSQKVRIHDRNSRTNDEVGSNTAYFNQNHDNDQFFQPVIHSNR